MYSVTLVRCALGLPNCHVAREQTFPLTVSVANPKRFVAGRLRPVTMLDSQRGESNFRRAGNGAPNACREPVDLAKC